MNEVIATDARRAVRRALISVYDKTGVVDFARGLHELGVEIVSTGSTAATIRDAGIPVTPVEQVTGFPECLDGRVKTLHPHVHAGILADRRRPEHEQQLADLGIAPFDLVAVNLYPFAATVAMGAGPEECVEQIDIGGPAMVRAAAKNHAVVAVVVDPTGYSEVLSALRGGGTNLPQRRRLAASAFAHTAAYDVQVSAWIENTLVESPDTNGFPRSLGATYTLTQPLRYGENPHQAAALYRADHGAPGIAGARQVHGKAMSYNNFLDADAAYRAAYDFEDPAVAVIKHTNPCGIAVVDALEDIAVAHRKAHATDPVSAFGGVIAANRPVTMQMARQIADVFTEVVIAPGFDPGAQELLAAKRNLRLLIAEPLRRRGVETRAITGGVLLQHRDTFQAAGDDHDAWHLVAGEPADATTLADLRFAWRAIRAVKSNAILLAHDQAAVGIGMGQVNRVDSARLAVSRAEGRARGSVAASDAFFPFPDGAQILIDAGVTAIVQPGGSIRDNEVIEAVRAAGVTMYLTGARHFAH